MPVPPPAKGAPALRERAPFSRRQRGLSLGGLYVGGALLALVWVSLPEAAGEGATVVAALAGVALLMGGVLLTVGHRLPDWCFHVLIASVQLVITAAHVSVGEPNATLWFYVWATPVTALFFRARWAVAHTSWTAVLAAVGLTAVSDGGPLQAASHWLLVVGTVIACALVVGWVGSTVRRRDESLLRAAWYDPLTGLPNRALLAAHVESAVQGLTTGGGRVVVMVLDLDRFRRINDHHGHHAGDEVLRALTPRLEAVVRPGDLLARLGGDEFAVCCVDRGSAAPAPGELARHVASALRAPVTLPSGQVNVTASIGLAQVTASTGPAQAPGRPATSHSLLSEADAAMYAVKARGGDGQALHDSTMRENVRRRLDIERRLREARVGTDLVLAYQPVVAMPSGRVVGAEALLRWHDAELGHVNPAEAVKVAEEAGLVQGIGTGLLDLACAQVAQWRDSGLVDDSFVVAVNVSPRQVTPELPWMVDAALRRHGLPASALALELTESSLLDATTATVDVLHTLRALGVQMLLDDFGTGYSSLSHLQHVPLDALKVDRSFVAAMATAPRAATIVAAIVGMARATGLRVVAEGVEDEDQADRLVALGCTEAQGYLFCRPVPAADFADVVRGARAGLEPLRAPA